jgi:hypothetical protein
MRAVALARSAAWAALGLAAACASSVDADPGATAYLRIPGAQFFRGPMPAGSASAPGVASVVLVNTFFHANTVDYPISGALDPGATAAAIGLQGDVGYWVVPAGLPNVATPEDPSYAATATFSAGVVPGSYTLVVRAVDAAGHFGLPFTEVLTAQPSPPGALVFALTWDTESDMDLHVVDPAGNEIYHGAMSDAPPPFAPQPDGGSYGFLDWDSNANCVIDGRREEDVVWPDPPPSGAYVVRVDAASLCGQSIARFTVRALRGGRVIAEAEGVAVDASTRGPHDRGAGVTMLEVSVP